MYTLDEIFNQAYEDLRAVKLIENGYQSISLYDVKIFKDNQTHQVEILNTSKSYYDHVSNSSKKVFQQYGWRCGCLDVTLSNIRLKLDKLETSIRDEVNGKSSEKTIKQLKSKRESFMTKYTQLNNKLNDTKKERDNI
jgi:hypothetical protein